MGISPSQLRGRATVTTYVYDDQGRVLQTVTASAWGEDDRKLMLAYREYQSSLCPGGCGHPRERAHHPDNDGWYVAEGVECHACTARARAERADSKEPVKPIELFGVVDIRDYTTQPLPAMPTRPERRGR